MAKLRKPFQGVLNIIRFNWHFYIIACFATVLLYVVASYIPTPIDFMIYVLVPLIILTTFLSLIASLYIYDLSGLYKLKWVEGVRLNPGSTILNIHAGFDETSTLLESKFSNSQLTALDFYDPSKHTEISIKRARKAYPPHPSTIKIKTDKIPFSDDSINGIFLLFSAHEIRNELEQIRFFKEINRVLEINGTVIIAEHLRDIPNFMIYNLGAFHFMRRSTWLAVFQSSGLSIQIEKKHTPFITIYILKKNGITS